LEGEGGRERESLFGRALAERGVQRGKEVFKDKDEKGGGEAGSMHANQLLMRI
jgi:hypothetical protein